MKQAQQNGFTLIELMVVVAIIGIIAAIAYPSYTESMMKSRRADAEGSLLSLANAMERYYTVSNTYCNTNPTVNAAVQAAANTCASTAGGTVAANNDVGRPPPAIYTPPNNTSTFYEISISAATDAGYTLTADPIGAQTNDRCGNLTLTNAGAKGFDAPGTAAECWKN
jgi:type IV pilus assembly protein PilE